MAKTYKGKSLRPGGGGRFAQLKDKLIDAGHSEESAKAIAAHMGRKKYGPVEFSKMAARGRKRASREYTVPV